MHSSNFPKLVTLIQKHEITHARFKNWDSADNITYLSESKKEGWKKILSSVATTEAIEHVLMTELKKAYLEKNTILNYLNAHQLDENTHHENINRYLLNTFRFQKKSRTFSDKIIYDIALLKLSKLFSKKPIFGLGLLLFFEIYGVHFYKGFKEQAKNDGLNELSLLINQIEEDEQRHIAGIKILLSEQKCKYKTNIKDEIQFKFILSIVILDVNMSFWALHNRIVRKQIFQIGLNPDALTKIAYSTAKQIYRQVMK